MWAQEGTFAQSTQAYKDRVTSDEERYTCSFIAEKVHLTKHLVFFVSFSVKSLY